MLAAARELIEGFVAVDRMQAELHAAVAEFDAAGLWGLDGATSMTAWLQVHAGRGPAEAKRIVSTAYRLWSLPVTEAAWRSGELSSGQVEAIVVNVRDDADRFPESELVPLLAGLSVKGVARAMQAWRSHLDDALPEDPERHLHLSETLGGRRVLSGSFDPEGGAIVAAAIEVAMVDDRDKKVSERQGDALVEVCRFFLDHHDEELTPRHRPQVALVVDIERWQGGVLDGARLDPATLVRQLCDAGVSRVITAGRSEVLDVGTETRTVPKAIRTALAIRDRHCRFPGCDRRSSWCEAHHIEHWKDGGPTKLSNLVLLCSRHHHTIHKKGWQAKLMPDGAFEVSIPP